MNAPGKLHSPTIDNARRQARIQSNRTGISLNQALDAQAVSMGFRHWHEAISVAQRNPSDARLMAQIDVESSKSPEQRRFIVRAKVGYDNGAGTRDLGVIGESDDLEEAQSIRSKYGADQVISNTQAAFAYAEIMDRQDEHAVVGLGKYGNGLRVASVRPVTRLCHHDGVLFRGSRQECLKHQEEYQQGKALLQTADQGEQLAVFGPSGAGKSGLKLEMLDKPAQDIDAIFASSRKLGIEIIRLQKEYQPAEEDEMPDSPPGEPAVYMMGSTAVFAPSGIGKSFVEQELRNGGEEPDDEQAPERPGM